jgi:hypothetical protein
MKNQQVYILFDSYKGILWRLFIEEILLAQGVVLWSIIRRQQLKQSWASFNAQKSKEIQAVYQRGHYVTAAGLRNDMLLGLGGLAVMFLSAAAGGVTLYFGGPGKAAIIYLATCVLGFTGVVVNCERE